MEAKQRFPQENPSVQPFFLPSLSFWQLFLSSVFTPSPRRSRESCIFFNNFSHLISEAFNPKLQSSFLSLAPSPLKVLTIWTRSSQFRHPSGSKRVWKFAKFHTFESINLYLKTWIEIFVACGNCKEPNGALHWNKVKLRRRLEEGTCWLKIWFRIVNRNGNDNSDILGSWRRNLVFFSLDHIFL